MRIDNLPQIFWLWFIAKKKQEGDWSDDEDSSSAEKDDQTEESAKESEPEEQTNRALISPSPTPIPEEESKDKEAVTTETAAEEKFDEILKMLQTDGDIEIPKEEKKETIEASPFRESEAEAKQEKSLRELVEEMNIPDEVVNLMKKPGSSRRSKRSRGFNLKGLEKAWEEFQDLQLPDVITSLSSRSSHSSFRIPMASLNLCMQHPKVFPNATLTGLHCHGWTCCRPLQRTGKR